MALKNVWIPVIVVIALAATEVGVIGCNSNPVPEKQIIQSNADLALHAAVFKQQVIRVTEGVYVAVGYGLANSILLEGRDAVVIVDTTESMKAATEIKKTFDQITSKPIKAIVYTHSHIDHWNGTSAFAGAAHPDVYAHASTLDLIDRFATITFASEYIRGMRQFGALLPPDAANNAGIGPFFSLGDLTSGYIRPKAIALDTAHRFHDYGYHRRLCRLNHRNETD
jgi:alkyl sulfatase BDS1-like metallo-beta-lactamase superfamily hydrolase